ncbi:OLC1v1000628C1 [Oldenlandia corymbosa var. corymbosa]|uniref:OLC1v1000628C1 n=1 Tax=Oldenlandia corymbosa var. corymbosa TaxID=529605 RepID=A0AAV1D3N5_OLDCO|nr:OLC1v1000628C1 [Oldenlandia corymbosa var. corymbosa]
MECNKDEAVRAKEIAERKLHSNDFEGARRIALRAQSLFPELENISQLLAVCNVHCSAESKMLGSEKDWYSILQVERSVDEATIKKQYRKLALVLHPDKNKFPGAEAAFKLIGEAHRVLSDYNSRSQYDAKVGVALKFAQNRPPSHKVNLNPPGKKQFPGQNSAPNGVYSQFSSANHQATQATATGSESFWTCCPICKIRYQFYKNVENKILRCQKCHNPYVAYNLGPHGVSGSSQSRAAPRGVPPPFNQSQPAKQKGDPIQGSYGSSGPRTGVPMASHAGNASAGSVSETELRSTGNANKTKDGKKEGTVLPEDVKLPNETGFTKKSRKRGKKSELDSDESCDISDDNTIEELETEKSCSGHATGLSSEGNTSHFVRRSDRQKHHVSYNENGSDDDDFESPPKRPRKESPQREGKPECEDVLNSAHPMNEQEKVPSPGPSVMEKKSCTSQTAAQKPIAPNEVAGKFGAVDVSESDVDSCTKSFVVPEFEFNNFDLLREASCFEIGQIWACYEDEGLPRFYAQIRKVYSINPFKVRMTWLEADPDDEDENDWVKRDLPVGCGKFKLGDSLSETNVCVFSHQMDCKMVSKKGGRVTFMVYPRKGETWALFKDWNIRWSTDEYKKCKYEIAEVVSEFVEGVGIEVVFLEKLNGFVSLFERRNKNGAVSVLVPATEIFRFSYRIPSFKMTGQEKEGVLEGSLELDPAGLANCDDACLPSVSDAGIGNRSGEANCTIREPPEMSKPKFSEDENAPKKRTDSMREIGVGGENFRLRKSPRGLKIVGENRQMDTSAGSESSGHVNCEESKSDFSLFTDGVATAQVDKRRGKERKGLSLGKSNSVYQSSSPGRKVSENLLHDFGENRSEKKFEVNQIWALYTPEQKLPKMYGQIKRVDRSPFRLHVAPLELISPPENKRQCVCGIFKVKGGKPRVFESSLFSHQLEPKVKKNELLIYPKVGEVWALYRDWTAESTPSALKNCAYRPVEIIEVDKDHIQVSPLVALTPDYKLVFRSFKKQTVSEVINVPFHELGRFSHQIPAIRLTAEKGRKFEGNWLLDAAAIPESK